MKKILIYKNNKLLEVIKITYFKIPYKYFLLMKISYYKLNK